MKQVVFLPGLGADHRLFDFIEVNNCDKYFLKWIKPEKNESMQSYLFRIKEQLLFSEPPVLVGVSLGGMFAMELRELIPVKKTILISSVKTKSEMPSYFNLILKLKLNEVVTPSIIKKGAPILKPFITKRFDKKAIQLFYLMLKDADDDFIHWAINLILDWNRTDFKKENLIHIHGSNDIVFPLRNIKNCNYVIKGGTHDMIMTSAAEISKILKFELTD